MESQESFKDFFLFFLFLIVYRTINNAITILCLTFQTIIFFIEDRNEKKNVDKTKSICEFVTKEILST